ncbi:MAG TPA: YbdK family carboxylate-amine ligase [Solirubrobacteraceae bacterium]|nr:YbdK family carboxylate-amine ligase [Solirubrobacteraceae bacterium]
MAKLLEHSFGNNKPFSLGAEEELFLVDPVTGRMVNTSAAVTERLASAMGGIERELHAGMIEFVSDVCGNAREVIGQLAHRRAACLGTGVGLLGSGTHPTAADEEARISDKERYERIHNLLGEAVAIPVAGLHVHVGMPDPETAIKVFNALRIQLPLLQALSANSPFRNGRDTGLASARGVIIRGWPRSGVPRAMRGYQDFCDTADLLTRAAGVDDYTWFWWKLRPHPKLGTVEIRTFDAQGSLHDAEALIALTHCLARAAAEMDEVQKLPTELLEEGMFRATRFGVDAQLPDANGDLHEFEEVLAETLEHARPFVRELDCEAALARIPAIAAMGGASGRQRAVHELSGMDSLLRELIATTAQTAGITQN